MAGGRGTGADEGADPGTTARIRDGGPGPGGPVGAGGQGRGPHGHDHPGFAHRPVARVRVGLHRLRLFGKQPSRQFPQPQHHLGGLRADRPRTRDAGSGSMAAWSVVVPMGRGDQIGGQGGGVVSFRGVELCLGQVQGRGEIRAMDERVSEIGPEQIDAGQVAVPQVGGDEVGAAQVRPAQRP